MRKIFADSLAFGLNNGDTVNITLFNKIGQELTTTYQNKLINFNKEITIENNKLEVELYENDKILVSSYYELLINKIKFRFQLNSNENNLSHELTSLIQLGSNDGISYFDNEKLIFEDEFIKKIELKLTNQEPYFSENQERVYDFFIFYANYFHGSGKTIDLEKYLDQYLGGING